MQLRDAISLKENQVLDQSQVKIEAESGNCVLLFRNRITEEWLELENFRNEVRQFKTPDAALSAAKKVGFDEVVVKM